MSHRPIYLFLSTAVLWTGAIARAQISPISITLGPSQQRQFSLAPGENATWQVAPQGSGTITSTGLYTAPPVYAATYAWVYARSLTPLNAAGNYYWQRAEVHLSSVSPATATVPPAGTQQFSVQNLPSGTSVAWTVSPLAGSITPAGLYTAPSSVAAQTTITVTATNPSTNSVLGTASLTLSAAAPTGVYVYPGNAIQTVVNAHPSGTTYIITPGVYRLQSITPKTGDHYIGQSGAILNGSLVATSFLKKAVSGVTYWVTAGPRQPGTVNGECETTSPMCAYPEDFFINNQVLQRVASLSAVTSNTCYFDYSAGEIYFLMNPTGQTVEIGTTPAAFSGDATNVTIQGLTIEKYAAPGQSGAILANASWTILSNTISFNHGAGIHMSSNDVIESNYIHHNGQQGVSGGGNQILIQNNEIAFNNTLGFDFEWEAGGIWFSNSTNQVVQGNFVHDNNGLGIHLDFQSYNWLVQGNRTQNNYLAGIDNEVGYGGTVRYNVVENDGVYPGKTNPSMWWACGIYVYASSNTNVYGNSLINNSNGICALSIPRDIGVGNRGPFVVQNLSVSDNVIVQSVGAATGAVADSGYYLGVYSSSWNNHWTSNTYKLPSATAQSYVWQGGTSYVNMDANQWQAFGNDVTGTWIAPTDSTFPSTKFTTNETVQTIAAAEIWSLPTTTSTLVKTEPNGTLGTVTKVAGPILTGGLWWWNITFADGTVGWCEETNLQKP